MTQLRAVAATAWPIPIVLTLQAQNEFLATRRCYFDMRKGRVWTIRGTYLPGH